MEIYRLSKLHTQRKEFADVMNILKSNNTFFAVIPKARTAKIVRNMLDIVATVPDSLSIQVSLCRDVIDWCKLEKRTFLRQRIESRVSGYSYVNITVHT
jgi:26S proteasome regulatory subunit N6